MNYSSFPLHQPPADPAKVQYYNTRPTNFTPGITGNIKINSGIAVVCVNLFIGASSTCVTLTQSNVRARNNGDYLSQ